MLVASLPNVGPCSERDDRACVVCKDHGRARSTGPCFPLTVARCLTHQLGFTLYPPGHVPYGRVAVAPVALDGSAIVGVAKGAQGLASTLFAAALDAADGTLWARQCPGGTDRWWSSQIRHIDAATRICGVVANDLAADQQQQMAAALQVEALLLRQGASAIGVAPGYRSRGAAVVAVLDRMAEGTCLLKRVLCAGELAGLWGPPHAWDAPAQRLRSWSFRGAATLPP